MASEINPALPSVFFSWPKKGHSAPDVMQVCAWCLVSQNIAQKEKFVIYHPLCEYCVMIKQRSKVPQTVSSSQNYVSDELFTPHFI